MRSRDVIELFDTVGNGARVFIDTNPLPVPQVANGNRFTQAERLTHQEPADAVPRAIVTNAPYQRYFLRGIIRLTRFLSLKTGRVCARFDLAAKAFARASSNSMTPNLLALPYANVLPFCLGFGEKPQRISLVRTRRWNFAAFFPQHPPGNPTGGRRD